MAEIVWRHPLASIAGRAAAIPGAFFAALCLATGSLWGRPAWGTWWEWDGRLTSMLVLLFLYLGYIALSGAAAREWASSRIPAIFGLVGVINVPVIHYSVLWWYSIHQRPSFSVGGSTMAPEFRWPLIAATIGFSCLFAAVVLMRMRALLAEAQAEARLRRRARGRLMAEGLDPWPFVTAAYALGAGGTLALVGWSWLAMRRAERKRDEARNV